MGTLEEEILRILDLYKQDRPLDPHEIWALVKKLEKWTDTPFADVTSVLRNLKAAGKIFTPEVYKIATTD